MRDNITMMLRFDRISNPLFLIPDKPSTKKTIPVAMLNINLFKLLISLFKIITSNNKSKFSEPVKSIV